MKFKSISFGAAIAASVVVGSIATATPSYAATVRAGDRLNFGGGATLVDATTPTTFLNFFIDTPIPGVGTVRTNEAARNTGPSSSVFDNPVFGIRNLSLLKTDTNSWTLKGGPVTDWLSKVSLLPAPVSNFTLTSFNLLRQVTSEGDVFRASYGGFFTPPTTGTPGVGSLTSQGTLEFSGSSYSSTVTAVPTPALLPGVIGMGIAAFRKRKGEATTETEKVEVKA